MAPIGMAPRSYMCRRRNVSTLRMCAALATGLWTTTHMPASSSSVGTGSPPFARTTAASYSRFAISSAFALLVSRVLRCTRSFPT
jgi:hypothetical protein